MECGLGVAKHTDSSNREYDKHDDDKDDNRDGITSGDNTGHCVKKPGMTSGQRKRMKSEDELRYIQ